MNQIIIAGISGLVFGLGLILSGMTDPSKVIAFLNVTGNWDPSLALVMGGAILVAIIPFTLVAKRQTNSFVGTPIVLPSNQKIDRRLIIGSVFFGAGWGIAGICPGPAMVMLGTGVIEGIIFCAAMIIGMLLGLFALKKIKPHIQ